MGQYHLVVNLTKREFLHPHKLGAGLKLMEQFWTTPGTAGPLLLLLSVSNGRGGGDARGEDPDGILGRWGGDQIAVVGDYAEDGDLPLSDIPASLIYSLCRDSDDDEPSPEYLDKLAEEGLTYEKARFTDISELVVRYIEGAGEDVRYAGDGWRQIVSLGSPVWRWKGQHPHNVKEEGRVKQFVKQDTGDLVTVEWPGSTESYPLRSRLPFFS